MRVVAIKNLHLALRESTFYREDFSRKGAKAQSAAAFLNGICFLCAFAPLREYYLFAQIP
jgi:hypothetical protein